jgi:HK97 family phage major capsid protein
MSDFLTVLRDKLQAKITERNAAKAELDAILEAPAAEARDLNDDEAARFAAAKDKVTALDAEHDDLQKRVDELAGMEARRYEAAVKTGGAKVKNEARTYSREAERDGVSFLADVATAFGKGYEPGAQERLARHAQEERTLRGADFERRAAATSAFAGLVVPQYLTDLVAPAVAAMRPLANVCRHVELPAEGMTVNISRITTATSAALQSSENSAVSETNVDDTLLSPAVQTAAGQQTLSLQALQRGTGVEAVVVGDLVRRYHTVLNSTLINQATNGLDAIAGVSVTYTDASPTAGELYPKLFDLIQQVQTAVYMGVSHFVMHPRRWNWLASQVGTSWPFLQVNGAGPQTAGSFNGTGAYDASAAGTTIAGTLAGVPVILDASIATNLGAGTNEDRIYGITADEAFLWEDSSAPLFIRAEQPSAASLGVLFVVYGYFAYTFGRYPSAHGKISGTGLVTPTF